MSTTYYTDHESPNLGGSAFDYLRGPEQTDWLCLGKCYENGFDHALTVEGIQFVCPECGERYANDAELAKAYIDLLRKKEERIAELESEVAHAEEQRLISESKLAVIRKVAA